MNCDTAFDLMTDPHGSRSGALAEHFAACPRCRRMQDALSPALDFLAESGSIADVENGDPPWSCGSREPFVTTESVQIALQAAAGLGRVTEVSSRRMATRTKTFAKYVAAFAAGLLLAIVAFAQRDRSVPPADTTCTRRAAARDDMSRTPAEIQMLARSCAVCHGTRTPASDDHTGLQKVLRSGSWDWLLPILDDRNRPVVETQWDAAGPLLADERAFGEGIRDFA
jgi:hypothetical protein